MNSIAVIGSGIAGMAAAHYLSRGNTVHLFEKEDRIGGHTRTVEVDSSRGRLPVDTGFIVHNDRTYPNLVRLLAELGVDRQLSDMSFAVTCRRTGFEYSSRGVRGFFAQRSNLLRPRHYRLLLEILRFNREALRALEAPQLADVTLAEFLDHGRYSPAFRQRYLYPMASAVWSTSLSAMQSFPAATLIRFFHNHGMLGIYTHPQWKVIRGGSRSYIPPLTAPYRGRIALGAGVTRIERSSTGVTLRFADRPPLTFDEVVLACHGDEVLPLLASPTPEEREVFQCFVTSRNEVCLHTDASILPKRTDARASWNYSLGTGGEEAPTLTYHMNRLQSLPVPEDYCVTLNAIRALDPERVLQTAITHHPLYTRNAIRAQRRWEEVSGKNRTHYCGAYWFYGFHEDGLNSALRVGRALGVDC